MLIGTWYIKYYYVYIIIIIKLHKKKNNSFIVKVYKILKKKLFD